MRAKEECMERELDKRENEQLLESEQNSLKKRVDRLKENIKYLITANREQ